MRPGRQVRRLFDLEIDEVSLVDKPANQFGKVAFSKRVEDEMPRLFDLEGHEVTEDELEHGETVVDDNGNEFVFLEEGTAEYAELAADVDSAYDDVDVEEEDVDEDERVLAGVGKRGPVRKSRMKFTPEGGTGFRQRTRDRATAHASRNRGRYGAAGAGLAAGAVGGRASKSFGATVYDELSKALNQSDRDEVITKALDVIDDLSDRYQQLEGYVAKMADDKAMADFSALAQEYGPLPVHPARLGAIMKRAADTLPAADVEILDRLFSSVGEQLYDEFGKGGTGDSLSVFDQVDALADEVVAKADMTREQAITAIFAENPDAYEEYLAESGQAGR